MNLKEGRNYIATKDVSFDNTINYDNGVKIPIDNEKFRLAPEQSILMCIEGGSAGKKIAFTNQIVYFGNRLCCLDSCVKTIPIPLPPLAEHTKQAGAWRRGIVAAIEKMLPLCARFCLSCPSPAWRQSGQAGGQTGVERTGEIGR